MRDSSSREAERCGVSTPPRRWSASLVGITGMGDIVVVDVGDVIGVDAFVVAWTFIGSVGLNPLAQTFTPMARA